MTAEFALLLPTVVVLLALGTGAVRVVVAQVQCVDAARAGARAAARGEGPDVVRWAARAAGPRGAEVSVRVAGSSVTVEVSSRQRIAGPVGGTVLARGSATAAAES
ncbi:TadE-like protein [Kineococcus rhizosphaerae]|uniref:TadE-like protein n=1 Tax=Kineococcus rhizosphaerae TaxID=559628 RepID=A0A2T0R5N7_9ACTN|nr:TadE-like protein [Kineococcus rhizosphaerae]